MNPQTVHGKGCVGIYSVVEGMGIFWECVIDKKGQTALLYSNVYRLRPKFQPVMFLRKAHFGKRRGTETWTRTPNLSRSTLELLSPLRLLSQLFASFPLLDLLGRSSRSWRRRSTGGRPSSSYSESPVFQSFGDDRARSWSEFVLCRISTSLLVKVLLVNNANERMVIHTC